ncbi:hypothetical protein M23134_02488 [Microscilla marina ATCC 23134]|uniref:Uncharacterized protein n=1 Tax=Microscilla marina ATCC 23134 TaxID=313606 RepID=A1ZZV1_MICM2|nr:hypothetical protein M23134_02488 [Microscilla marina ATCC 23134]
MEYYFVSIGKSVDMIDLFGKQKPNYASSSHYSKKPNTLGF